MPNSLYLYIQFPRKPNLNESHMNMKLNIEIF
jgi:hypothetical protein